MLDSYKLFRLLEVSSAKQRDERSQTTGEIISQTTPSVRQLELMIPLAGDFGGC